MRIVIPSWHNHVSPVLDVAELLLLVEYESGKICSIKEIRLGACSPKTLAYALKKVGVDIVICGVLGKPYEFALLGANISIVSGICGAVDEVLAAHMENRLSDKNYLMPGARL